jgi:predicted nucleotidyltransferase
MHLEPDLDLGRRFFAQNPPPGRVLLCAVTGSHHYGFPSPDSDIDLKGIHLAHTDALLGLHEPPDTHDKLEVFEGTECDLTTHEAAKAIRLVLRGNGNMLERIRSPYQLFETPELHDLRRLARAALSRRVHGHYRGYFRGVCQEHEKAGPFRAKPLLYAYRVALTGTHLLLTGEVVASLPELAERYRYPEALELLEKKRRTAEKVVLSPDEDARHRAAWPRLLAELDAAREASPLPEAPQNEAELDAWLRGKRRRALGL